MSVRSVHAHEHQQIRSIENPTLSKIVKVALAAILTVASFALLPRLLSIIIASIVISFTIKGIQDINHAARQALEPFPRPARGWFRRVPFWQTRNAPSSRVDTPWFSFFSSTPSRVPAEARRMALPRNIPPPLPNVSTGRQPQRARQPERVPVRSWRG